MKKIALFFAVTIATALAVPGAAFVWRMLETNDWIDRCSDETSGAYIADRKVREDYCARTADSMSRDP